MTTRATKRQILFSGPMVRAIIEGRKSQTRRIIKPQPLKQHHIAYIVEAHGRGSSTGGFEVLTHYATTVSRIACPYGSPGDHLWIRETFAEKLAHTGKPLGWAYRADGDRASYELGNGRWRPSIFMPRHASRITLEIVKVRAERLQKISGFDAAAEGYPGPQDDASIMHFGEGKKARHWYRELWDSINAKRGVGWDKNPWVWVIEFKVLKS